MSDVEPLLQECTKKRYTLFPIPKEEQRIYDFYLKHRAALWTPEELDLENERRDFEQMDEGVQHYLMYTLGFFASSDVLVGDNLKTNFIEEIKACPTFGVFFGFQSAMEDIHSEVYSLLIDKLIASPKKKDHLFNAIETIPCIRRKAQWILQYMKRSVPFVKRLMAFALFEGVAFASSFASIFFIRHCYPGKLKGLVLSNELIARDESLHCDVSIYMYVDWIVHKLTDKEAHEIVESLLVVERDFVLSALPTSLIGLSPEMMVQYVEFSADNLLERMGHSRMYGHKKCPLEFMNAINAMIKVNFFEARSGNYALPDAHQTELNISDTF